MPGAGAGARPGTGPSSGPARSDGAPAVRRGERTGRPVRRHVPTVAGTSSPRCPGAPVRGRRSPGPGTSTPLPAGGPVARRAAAGQATAGQRPGGREGDRASGHRQEACRPPRGTVPGSAVPPAGDPGLPGGSARCLPSRSRAGGRGRIRRAERSAGARREHRRRWARCGRGRPRGDVRGNRVDDPCHPGKRVAGPACSTGERGTTFRGWVPWSRQVQLGAGSAGRGCDEGARTGNGSAGGPFAGQVRRGGRGEPRTGHPDGSPRAPAPPAPPGVLGADTRGVRLVGPEVRTGRDGGVDRAPYRPEDGQSRGGRQPTRGWARAGGSVELGEEGRAVASGAAVPVRDPGDEAGPAGTSAAAGEDATGWIEGVLGSSRSTTGGSTSCRAGRAGRPQARCSPWSPAPQRAIRRPKARTAARRRPGSGAGCAGTRQARFSPCSPAPQSAIRRAIPRSPPRGWRTRSGTTTTRGVSGAGTRVARAGGAGRTDRSGTGRAAVRWCAGRWRGRTSSARSRTPISPASVPAGVRPGRSARRAPAAGRAARWLLLMSPPEVVSAAGEGAADKEKGKDRERPDDAVPTPRRMRVTEPLPGSSRTAGDPFPGPFPCRLAGAP